MQSMLTSAEDKKQLPAWLESSQSRYSVKSIPLLSLRREHLRIRTSRVGPGPGTGTRPSDFESRSHTAVRALSLSSAHSADMAVRSKAASRLPEEQLREREKDGRIRRFICGVLTLRVLAYIIAQPASFTFITSFLFITLTMPPMAAYIKNAGDLPDLDTMRVRPCH